MKFKLYDRVKFRKKYIKWELEHFIELRSIDRKTIGITLFGRMNQKSLDDYAFWIAAHKGIKTHSVIIGFNSENHIKVASRNKFGHIIEYFDEEHLKLRKNK